MTVKIPDSLPWSANGDGAGSIQNSAGGWLTNEADINERAAYIVHACNAYPALVEALHTVQAAVRSYLPPNGDGKDVFIARVIEAVDNPRINCALKAAGVEP